MPICTRSEPVKFIGAVVREGRVNFQKKQQKKRTSPDSILKYNSFVNPFSSYKTDISIRYNAGHTLYNAGTQKV